MDKTMINLIFPILTIIAIYAVADYLIDSFKSFLDIATHNKMNQKNK